MKSKPKKATQPIPPPQSYQRSERLSTIPLDDEIKSLAHELREIGAKLILLGDKHRLEFSYLAATVADEAAGEALRNAYLVFKERLASYYDCPVSAAPPLQQNS